MDIVYIYKHLKQLNYLAAEKTKGKQKQKQKQKKKKKNGEDLSKYIWISFSPN